MGGEKDEYKFYGVVVYVWKGHLILNKKSSVRLPSDATIFALIEYRLVRLTFNQ